VGRALHVENSSGIAPCNEVGVRKLLITMVSCLPRVKGVCRFWDDYMKSYSQLSTGLPFLSLLKSGLVGYLSIQVFRIILIWRIFGSWLESML